MSASASEFLKNLSLSKKHPEFAAEIRELSLADSHAQNMRQAGKLTKAEYADLQAHFFQKTMEALPVEMFEDMMKDGSLHDLQALGGHDGTRGNVDDVRASLMNKIKADALDEAWLDQRISAEDYARENADLERPSDDLSAQMDKGDHNGAAAEMFAARNDVVTHDKDLNAYLDKTYGEKRQGREEPSGQVMEEEPAARPVREAKYDGKKSTVENLTEFMGKHRPEESPSATDKNGITDLDVLDEQEADL